MSQCFRLITPTLHRTASKPRLLAGIDSDQQAVWWLSDSAVTAIRYPSSTMRSLNKYQSNSLDFQVVIWVVIKRGEAKGCVRQCHEMSPRKSEYGQERKFIPSLSLSLIKKNQQSKIYRLDVLPKVSIHHFQKHATPIMQFGMKWVRSWVQRHWNCLFSTKN